MEEEEGIRQLTRYEKAVAWANKIMKALETIGITPRTVQGVGVVIITGWTVGAIVTIGLIVQVTRLTRMMKRVRETIDVKMDRAK